MRSLTSAGRITRGSPTFRIPPGTSHRAVWRTHARKMQSCQTKQKGRKSSERSILVSRGFRNRFASDEERPSITAEGAAVMHAIHQALDGSSKILDDPVSPLLVDARSGIYKLRLELLDRLPEPTRRPLGVKLSSALSPRMPFFHQTRSL
jgi:hypothetical protein